MLCVSFCAAAAVAAAKPDSDPPDKLRCLCTRTFLESVDAGAALEVTSACSQLGFVGGGKAAELLALETATGAIPFDRGPGPWLAVAMAGGTGGDWL